MQKYIKLTWNGGRTLNLKWEDYLKKEKYWSKQQCVSEIYFENIISQEKVGEGKNSSDLTKDECMSILYDWGIDFASLFLFDLDSLYFVANNHWAYHLTKDAYVRNLNKYRLKNLKI